jgi:hypothetical protein
MSGSCSPEHPHHRAHPRRRARRERSPPGASPLIGVDRPQLRRPVPSRTHVLDRSGPDPAAVDWGGGAGRRPGPKELELRTVRSIAPWHSAPTPRVRQDGAPSSVSPRRRRPRGRPRPRSAPAHIQGGRPHAAPGQGARCVRVATDWPASPAPAVAHRDGVESGSSDLQQHHRAILRTPGPGPGPCRCSVTRRAEVSPVPARWPPTGSGRSGARWRSVVGRRCVFRPAMQDPGCLFGSADGHWCLTDR